MTKPTKQDFQAHVGYIFARHIEQVQKAIDENWETLEKEFNDDYWSMIRLTTDEEHTRDIEEQFLLNILGILNLASMRIGLQYYGRDHMYSKDVLDLLDEEIRQDQG